MVSQSLLFLFLCFLSVSWDVFLCLFSSRLSLILPMLRFSMFHRLHRQGPWPIGRPPLATDPRLSVCLSGRSAAQLFTETRGRRCIYSRASGVFPSPRHPFQPLVMDLHHTSHAGRYHLAGSPGMIPIGWLPGRRASLVNTRHPLPSPISRPQPKSILVEGVRRGRGEGGRASSDAISSKSDGSGPARPHPNIAMFYHRAQG
ncbi:hypothetical protein LX36DRAFT_366085 [Colletotrichum falcatum]|nr:hypothetical protein LX36DRAFT_366085 [Colletotrichum falcatum]